MVVQFLLLNNLKKCLKCTFINNKAEININISVYDNEYLL